MSFLVSSKPKEVQKYIEQHIEKHPGNIDIWLSILVSNEQYEIAEWLIHHHRSQIFTSDKARYTLFSRAIGCSKILTTEHTDWLVKNFDVKDEQHREWLISDANRNKQPNASILYLMNKLEIDRNSHTIYNLFQAACARNDVSSAATWLEAMRGAAPDNGERDTAAPDSKQDSTAASDNAPFVNIRKLFVEACYKEHIEMMKWLDTLRLIDVEMINASLRVIMRKQPPFNQEVAQWLFEKGAKVSPDIVLHVKDPEVFSWILSREVFIRKDIVNYRNVVSGVLEQTIHARNWPLAVWYITEFFNEIDEQIDDVDDDLEDARKKGFATFCTLFEAYQEKRLFDKQTITFAV
jgi:hypothetical protein